MKQFLLVCASMLCVTIPAFAQTVDSKIPTSAILSADLIQTNAYRIAPEVSVRDHLFQFNVETKYGTLQVAGLPLLEKRLSELQAIEEIGTLGNETAAITSAWATLKETPRGAGHLLTDPMGTLSVAPRGFGRMAANFIDPVARRTGSKTRRQLAANLGVDSETRNPVLDALLDRMVARKFVGSTAAKLALSAALPGLGTLSSLEEARQSTATRSPHELVVDMDTELTRLGVWAPVKDAFLRNRSWTLLEKVAFVGFYRQLAGVQHADVMLYLANQDTTESDILRRLIEMRLLTELQAKQKILTISEAGLPIAWLADGQIVGVCSVDHLTNTKTVQDVAQGFRSANPDRNITLFSTGWVSAEAGKTLDANKITFLRPGSLNDAGNRLNLGRAEPMLQR